MTMRPQLQSLYLLARELHQASVEAEVATQTFLSQCGDKHDAADAAYALREVHDLCDDVKRRCHRLNAAAQRLGASLQLADGSPEAIRTDHCTATPKMRTIVSMPKRSTHPKEFGALMSHMGVPRQLWEARDGDENKEAVRPHWPGMIDLIADLLAEGKPMPPGIDPNKTYAEYTLVIRGKKGVAE